ncbi:hypothetical protein [Methanobrevibacter sp.]|uniref:hypothetical protein n=1 Tax=Methanobrevibacter sp. TaxID=66852 RepID=UPI00386CB008
MKIIDKFRKQHPLIQALDIMFIILLTYELITMQNLSITWIVLFLIIFIPFCQWYLKKED